MSTVSRTVASTLFLAWAAATTGGPGAAPAKAAHSPRAALFESSFATPDGPLTARALPGWRLEDGDYRVEDGWLGMTSQRRNPVARLTMGHVGDGTFRATVRGARQVHRVGLEAQRYRLEINNQYQRLELGYGDTVLATADDYFDYARREDRLELRLSFAGDTVSGFVDERLLVRHVDPARPSTTAGEASAGAHALYGGWGTDVAWSDVSLSADPDLTEWVRRPLVTAVPAPIEVTDVRSAASDNIYQDGDTVSLSYRVRGRGAGRVPLILAARVTDVHDRVVDEQVERVVVPPDLAVRREVAFRPQRRGSFKVALYAGPAESALAWVEDLGAFAVLPPLDASRAAAGPGDRSYFGGHLDGINLRWHLGAGRKLGVRWVRTHDMLQHTWWPSIQPDGPARYAWGDTAQRAVDREGLSTLGTFLYVPEWAGPDPIGPPADWRDFERYVGETVRHYSPSIRHWEVWNEPFQGIFWHGTPADHATLFEKAYDSAKAADPRAMVFGGGGASLNRLDDIERMLDALRIAAGVRMDGFSFHLYEVDGAGAKIRRLRALLQRHGLSVPIWNTETAVTSSSFFDQIRRDDEPEARYHFRNACFELVRLYMENIANGVERIFYYQQADPNRRGLPPKPRASVAPRGHSMWDEGRALKPIGAAHAALAFAIEGKRFRSRHRVGDLEAFVFDAGDTATAVHYATFPRFATRASVRLRLPEGVVPTSVRVLDFMANPSLPAVEGDLLTLPLSREPVYLIYEGPDAGAVLERSYAAATEVGRRAEW